MKVKMLIFPIKIFINNSAANNFFHLHIYLQWTEQHFLTSKSTDASV